MYDRALLATLLIPALACTAGAPMALRESPPANGHGRAAASRTAAAMDSRALPGANSTTPRTSTGQDADTQVGDALTSTDLVPTVPLALDWASARELVLASSPDIEIARARTERARAALELARSARSPRIDLAAEWIAADAPSSYLFKTIDARGLEPGTDFNDPGSFAAAELGLELQWNLYDGGARSAREQAARAHTRGSEQQARVLQDGLIETLSLVWVAVRAAEVHIQNDEVSLRTVQAQLDEVRARFASGRALRSDLLSLEVRLAEASEVLVRARSARQLALVGLAQLVGREVVELTGPGPASLELPFEVESALAIALIQRPELELAQDRIEAATADYEAARSARSLRADVIARVWRDETDGDFGDPEQNWLVGLKLGLPLVDGGGRSSAISAARAARTEARFASDQSLRRVEYEVRTSWLRLAEARTRAEVAEAAVEQARESLELVRLQYEAGSAAITRYMEAESMSADARRRKADADFDIRRAEFAAARSLGWAQSLGRPPRDSGSRSGDSR